MSMHLSILRIRFDANPISSKNHFDVPKFFPQIVNHQHQIVNISSNNVVGVKASINICVCNDISCLSPICIRHLYLFIRIHIVSIKHLILCCWYSLLPPKAYNHTFNCMKLVYLSMCMNTCIVVCVRAACMCCVHDVCYLFPIRNILHVSYTM